MKGTMDGQKILNQPSVLVASTRQRIFQISYFRNVFEIFQIFLIFLIFLILLNDNSVLIAHDEDFRRPGRRISGARSIFHFGTCVYCSITEYTFWKHKYLSSNYHCLGMPLFQAGMIAQILVPKSTEARFGASMTQKPQKLKFHDTLFGIQNFCLSFLMPLLQEEMIQLTQILGCFKREKKIQKP